VNHSFPITLHDLMNALLANPERFSKGTANGSDAVGELIL
jgi:hypothetical protein